MSIENRASPVDRFRLVYCSFFLYGVAALLPWNFILNNQNYFIYKLRNTSLPDNSTLYKNPSHYTSLQVTYVGYLSIGGQVANVVFQLLNTVLTNRVRNSVRVAVPLSLMTIVMALTAVLVKVDSDAWQHLFMIITVISLFFFMTCSAILQGALAGLAGMFPSAYMQAVMAGGGLSGALGSIVYIIVLLVFKDDVISGLIYFCLATVVLVATLVVYFFTSKTEFVRHYQALHAVTVRQSQEANRASLLQQSPDSEPQRDDISWSLLAANGPIFTILKQAKWIAFSVFMTFFTCLACFPTIVVNIRPVDYADNDLWTSELFVPVCCFLIFNLFDFIGRMATKFVQWPRPRGIWLPLLALLRLAFVPLYLFCNVTKANGRSMPVLFHTDVVPPILTALFGFSTGYLGTLSMIYGPRAVRPEFSEMAGSLMMTTLTVGLVLGSLLSNLLIYIA